MKLKYILALANISYIAGEYDESKKYITSGIALASSDTSFTYDTIEEVFKVRNELKSMESRCEAKGKNVSALDLKPQSQD